MSRYCVVLLAATLLPVQYVAYRVSWETLGEIPQAFAGLIILSNVLILPLALWRPAFASSLLVPWLLVVPVVGYSTYQHWRAQAEAARIVGWAYEQRLHNGSFPGDLSKYDFSDSGIADGIFRYETRGEGEFVLSYGAPGQGGSAHWYDSKTGWDYYPD